MRDIPAPVKDVKEQAMNEQELLKKASVLRKEGKPWDYISKVLSKEGLNINSATLCGKVLKYYPDTRTLTRVTRGKRNKPFFAPAGLDARTTCHIITSILTDPKLKDEDKLDAIKKLTGGN